MVKYIHENKNQTNTPVYNFFLDDQYRKRKSIEITDKYSRRLLMLIKKTERKKMRRHSFFVNLISRI